VEHRSNCRGTNCRAATENCGAAGNGIPVARNYPKFDSKLNTYMDYQQQKQQKNSKKQTFLGQKLANIC